MKYFSWLFQILKFHKLKIVFLIFATVACTFFIFPFDDLGDFVASKVAELTQNQVIVQFDHLGFSFIPQLGVELENVYLETPMLPALNVGALSVSPSLMGLITFKPGVSIQADKIFKGSMHVSTRGLGKTAQGALKQNLNLDIQKVDLAELMKLARSPVAPGGQLQLTSTSTIDLGFAEQPQGNLDAKIQNFYLPNSTVPTMMGPMALPELKLKHVIVNGELKNGHLQIAQATLGEASDELHAQVSGDLEIRINKAGPNIIPSIGSYNLDVKLDVKKPFIDKAGLFLTFLDAYKTAQEAGGASYSMKISAPSVNAPAKISR